MNEKLEVVLHEIEGKMMSYIVKNKKTQETIGWMGNEFFNQNEFYGFDSDDNQIFSKLELWQAVQFFEKYYVEKFE